MGVRSYGDRMTPEEFRAAGHLLVDWIADHRARVPELPVAARVKPGQVAAGLAEQAPESPEAFAAVLGDLEDVVAPGITQTQSPRFFPSQAGRHWFDRETFVGLMRLRGMEAAAPSRYAEAFTGRKVVLAP